MSDQSDDSIDPLEEFSAEQQALDSLARRIFGKIKAKMAGSSSRRRTRKYINRDREGAHQRLVADYFAEEPQYSDAMFRRRFRMRRHVFLRIVNALGSWSPYFTQRVDCTKRPGLSPLQKCIATIRMLAYRTAADMLDE
jgi:predicted ATP-grasp superfamily ATP-dependent carboligase